MNIIEWLNSNFDAGDAILHSLIALAVWFIIWHLIISKLFEKYTFIGELMDYGPILAPLVSFGILLFLSVIAVLFIASIQAAFDYGTGLTFVMLLFWGGLITFIVLLIRHIKK